MWYQQIVVDLEMVVKIRCNSIYASDQKLLTGKEFKYNYIQVCAFVCVGDYE